MSPPIRIISKNSWKAPVMIKQKKQTIQFISKMTATFALLASAALITGCENQDEVALYKAQNCLDDADTTIKAQACLDSMAGLSGASADKIRCSGAFIAQGFTGERMITAFEKNKESNGASPFVSMMAYLVFTEATPNISQTLSWCESGGVKSLKALAAVAQIATTAADLAGNVGDFDPNTVDQGVLETAMANAVSNLATANDNVANEQIGSAALALYGPYCSESGSYANTDMCAQVSQAINSSDGSATDIGARLAALLNAP